MAVKYYVLNGHTLGYVNDLQPTHFGILSGGLHGLDWRHGYTIMSPRDKLVPATKEDFEKFRIMLPPDFE